MDFGGYQVQDFTFEGREAKLICPEKPIGRLALKMEYWGAYPDLETKLVDRGYHLAYIKNTSRFAPREDCDVKARFVRFLAERYDLCLKCVPIGMSLGGAHAIRFAGFYPELIGCVFLDAPIVNYCAHGSCRMGSANGVWEREVQKTYPGLKHYQLASFSENPVHMAEVLVKNEIPVVMCWGEEDATVCYADHGALLEEAYSGTGLLISLAVPFRGHHPHGLLGDNGKLVDLIEAFWK